MDRLARNQDVRPSHVANRDKAKGRRGETIVVMTRPRTTDVAVMIQNMHLDNNVWAPLTNTTSKGKVQGTSQTRAGNADMADVSMHPHVPNYVDTGSEDLVDVLMHPYVPTSGKGPPQMS